LRLNDGRRSKAVYGPSIYIEFVSERRLYLGKRARTHRDLNISPPGAYVFQTSILRRNEGRRSKALCGPSFYIEFLSGRRLDHRERWKTHGDLHISPPGAYILQTSKLRRNDSSRSKVVYAPSFYIELVSRRRLDHREWLRTHRDPNLPPRGAYILQTSKLRRNEGSRSKVVCGPSFYIEFVSRRRLDHREWLRTHEDLNVFPPPAYIVRTSKLRLNDGRRSKAVYGPSIYIEFVSERRLDLGERARTHRDLNISPPGAYILQTSILRLNEGRRSKAVCGPSIYIEFVSERRLDLGE
jgi:hypothetical protein